MNNIEEGFHQNKSIEGAAIVAPMEEPITGSIYIKPSESLLKNPAYIKRVFVYSIYAGISWTNISLLMQHFHMVSNTFPEPRTDQVVFEELKDPWNSATNTEGLFLALHTYNDDDSFLRNDCEHEFNANYKRNNSKTTSHDDELLNDSQRNFSTGFKSYLHVGNTNTTEVMDNSMRQFNSLPELDKVNSLVLGLGLYPDDYPLVLQQYLWPELRNLLIQVKDVNLTQILDLKRTAPKLNCLSLGFHMGNIPDFVWTFDWDSLPWKTGFAFVFYHKPRNFTGKFRLISGSKTEPSIIPPVNFYYAFSVLTQISYSHTTHKALQIDRSPLYHYLDFSHNRLETLGYFQATLINNMNLYLNFSHNNL